MNKIKNNGLNMPPSELVSPYISIRILREWKKNTDHMATRFCLRQDWLPNLLAPCKLKMWGPLLINYWKFQSNYNRALKQARGPLSAGSYTTAWEEQLWSWPWFKIWLYRPYPQSANLHLISLSLIVPFIK